MKRTPHKYYVVGRWKLWANYFYIDSCLLLFKSCGYNERMNERKKQTQNVFIHRLGSRVYICKNVMRVVRWFCTCISIKWPYIGIFRQLSYSTLGFFIDIITVIINIIRGRWIESLSSLLVKLYMIRTTRLPSFRLGSAQVFCDILKNDLEQLNKRFAFQRQKFFIKFCTLRIT